MAVFYDIRRFRLSDDNGTTCEFRLLEPHKRNIILANGRSYCLQFPYTVCWSSFANSCCTASFRFYGMGFSSTPTVHYNQMIYVPPLPHFDNFRPTCHPESGLGRDSFERDFIGFFGSPFHSDVFVKENRNVFKASFGGSFREWAKLDLDGIVAALKKTPNVRLFNMVRDCMSGGKLEWTELSPIRGERISNEY